MTHIALCDWIAVRKKELPEEVGEVGRALQAILKSLNFIQVSAREQHARLMMIIMKDSSHLLKQSQTLCHWTSQ